MLLRIPVSIAAINMVRVSYNGGRKLRDGRDDRQAGEIGWAASEPQDRQVEREATWWPAKIKNPHLLLREASFTSSDLDVEAEVHNIAILY